jgi:kumamolisin
MAIQDQNQDQWVPIPGSERTPAPFAEAVGESDPDENLKVTVMLRRRPGGPPLAAMVEELGAQPSAEREYFDHDQLEQEYGARAEDIALVKEHIQRFGDLKVIEEHPGPRLLVLKGKLGAVQAAFGMKDVEQAQVPERPDLAPRSFRQRAPGAPLRIPPELDGIVQGVFGIDDRPEVRTWPLAQVHMEVHLTPFSMEVHANLADPRSLANPAKIAERYKFPDGDGEGQTIAMIQLGGTLDQEWVQEYLRQLHPAIGWDVADRVDEIHLNDVQFTAGENLEYDREVTLDVQVAAGVAPKAKILIYYAENTSRGFITALAKAIHCDGPPPAAISCSWGDAEGTFTHQAMRAVDELLQDAAALGITVCCASGNEGASGGRPGRNCDFPSSSPHVLACGGTSCYSRPEEAEGVVERGPEVAWTNLKNDMATGGGVSRVFPIPGWQAGANVPVVDEEGRPCGFIGGGPGRGVPDLAGHADPTEGYPVGPTAAELIEVGDHTDLSKERLLQDWAVAGTSAVAPLMAGLAARINQRLPGRTGYLNPFLYRKDVRELVFHDILGGSNGAYVAGENWDALTGWGTIDGEELLKALKG